MKVLSNPDLDAFLAAICQNEPEDTPRLVFADWLDEQGGEVECAWAELIRLQCLLARHWPYPEPPREWDQVGPIEVQREYHAAEKRSIALLKEYKLRIVDLGGMSGEKTRTKLSRVKFRRGFPGLRTTAKEVFEIWAPRPSWKLFLSLTLSSVGGRPIETAKIIGRDTLNEVAFLPDSNIQGIANCLSHFDDGRKYRYPDKGDGPGSLHNLRRLGIGVYNLNMSAVEYILAMEPAFYPEVRVAVTAYDHYSRHAIDELQSALGGQRTVIDVRPNARNAGTPPPGGGGDGGVDYGPPPSPPAGGHAPGGWGVFDPNGDPYAALLGPDGEHLRHHFPKG